MYRLVWSRRYASLQRYFRCNFVNTIAGDFTADARLDPLPEPVSTIIIIYGLSSSPELHKSEKIYNNVTPFPEINLHWFIYMVTRQLLGRGVRSAAGILITARVIPIAEWCEGLAYASRRKRRSLQTSGATRLACERRASHDGRASVARVRARGAGGKQLETDKIWRQCDV